MVSHGASSQPRPPHTPLTAVPKRWVLRGGPVAKWNKPFLSVPSFVDIQKTNSLQIMIPPPPPKMTVGREDGVRGRLSGGPVTLQVTQRTLGLVVRHSVSSQAVLLLSPKRLPLAHQARAQYPSLLSDGIHEVGFGRAALCSTLTPVHLSISSCFHLRLVSWGSKSRIDFPSSVSPYTQQSACD